MTGPGETPHLPATNPLATTAPPPHHRRRARRWAPRGALAFLALSVVLVVVFVVARPDWFDGENGESVPPELLFATTLADLGHRDGIRLSDDNTTSATVTTAVPVDSRLEDARLVLGGRTQAATSGVTFLRVLADGEAVYVTELRSGDNDLAADIPLPATVTDDGSVTVQIRLTGSLDQRWCNPDHEIGALVMLDPEATRIRGRLDQRLRTVRDVARGLDNVVTLVLSATRNDREWYETAAELGVALRHTGRQVRYVDGVSENPGEGTRILLGPPGSLEEAGWTPVDDQAGAVRVGYLDDTSVLAVTEAGGPPAEALDSLLTTDVVTTADSAANAPRRDEREPVGGDAVPLAALGLDTSAQQLTDSRNWRLRYSTADLPGGRVPSEVRLDLQVPVVAADAPWLVQVRLNGQLLDSVRLPADLDAHSVTARIPEGIEALRNELIVTVLRERVTGGCAVRPTVYQAQLLPTSTLLLGGRGVGLAAVPSDLAPGFEVHLPASSVDDPEVSLAALVPTLAEFTGVGDRAPFVWDGAPGVRPFLLFGDAPAGVDVPVRVVGGRLVGAGFDLQAFRDGLVVQRAAAGPTPGVVVTPVGRPPDVLPGYGRESARLVTGDGVGVAVDDAGRLDGPLPVRDP